MATDPDQQERVRERLREIVDEFISVVRMDEHDKPARERFIDAILEVAFYRHKAEERVKKMEKALQSLDSNVEPHDYEDAMALIQPMRKIICEALTESEEK